MSERHFEHWPERLPRRITPPATSLYRNIEAPAARHPDKPCLIYYDSALSFAEFREQTERLAGFLVQRCGVAKGDRVLLYTQNSPQYVVGYYAILRADAVVVPVNPMNLTNELRHYVTDTGATTIITTQELYPQVQPLLGHGLRCAVVGAYSDYLHAPTDLRIPDFVAAPRRPIRDHGVTLWSDAVSQNLRPGALMSGPGDLCVMPYTSGTTGQPKGCMHTHAGVMHTAVGGEHWFGFMAEDVRLATLPFFHVTGMQGSMNGPLYSGNTTILMTRWDREVAAELIARYRVTGWKAISTMVVDFLANPELGRYDLSSLRSISGGGAAMPAAVAQRLHELCGLKYVEGYGLSETIAPTHTNPPHRPKPQCLGIPIFDVEARVIDPTTLREVPAGQTGEIIVRGPQVFRGYWNNPRATAESFIDFDGKQFFRTGDLGRIDEDGYFFMVDRLKRMINASGFKVWPAEVEAMLYHHPAVQEACIIGARDTRRGETVKAVVVLRPEARGKTTEQDLIDWARGQMAAYKAPRVVEFVDQLPKNASGKIMWRTLQERELSQEASA
ncbi:MAG: long-chain fatty acid--CoA ligase [Sulfurifustis sp.]